MNLTARVRAKEPKMAEFWGGLKSNQRRSQRFCGRWGLTKTQLRGFFLILRSFFFTTDLVPEPNPIANREYVRGSLVGGKNYFCLAAAARVAPRPQDHARRVRWGLRRGFYFCGPF